MALTALSNHTLHLDPEYAAALYILTAELAT